MPLREASVVARIRHSHATAAAGVGNAVIARGNDAREGGVDQPFKLLGVLEFPGSPPVRADIARAAAVSLAVSLSQQGVEVVVGRGRTQGVCGQAVDARRHVGAHCLCAVAAVRVVDVVRTVAVGVARLARTASGLGGVGSL